MLPAAKPSIRMRNRSKWPCVGANRRSQVAVIAALLLLHLCSSTSGMRLRASVEGRGDTGAAALQSAKSTSTRVLSQAGEDKPGCPKPEVNLTRDRYHCVEWRKACLDQNVIVSFDKNLHPFHSMGILPELNITEIMYNIPSKYGIGDRFRKGSALRFPALYVRPSNDMEEEPELQNPVFSNCTLPMLVYAHYPYNAAETYRYIFEKLVNLQEERFFNRHVTLVPGVPPGTRVPQYTKFWYNSLSDRAVVSLSQLSSRRSTDTPSNATWEGRHIRCFERVIGCRIRYDGFGLRFYNAGQHVVRHYMPHFLAQSDEFERRLKERYQVDLSYDPTVFKIVFITRTEHQSAVGRTILNEQDIIDRCNAATDTDLPPADWNVPYKRYMCFAYLFGENQLMDVWLMRRVDAIVGMHGAGLTNSLYMKPGGAAVEIRPLGFSGRESWANRYARFQTSSLREVPWSVFWYGIDTFNASLSEPSMFEKDDKPHYSKFRAIKARDRHVRVTWPSFRHQLLNMAAVARTYERYKELRLCGAHYITDDLQMAELPGHDPHVDKNEQRTFTSPEEERLRILSVPKAQKYLDFAATPDRLP